MIESKIEDILKKIGLAKLEIDCYLALLKRSPQRASELATRFATPKATVLLALNQLTDKLGIIKRTKKKNTYLFLIEDVKDLVDFVVAQEEKAAQTKREVFDLLPQLRGIQNYEVNKPKIYYFEGKGGIKQVLEQVLEEADHYAIYGSVEDDLNFLPEVYPAYYDRRVAKGITTKAIVPALPLSIPEIIDNEVKHKREAHLVPPEWNYNIQFNFYKNTVVFFSYEEGFVLMIKSKPIAECLLRLFQLAYERAADYDKQIRASVGNNK